VEVVLRDVEPEDLEVLYEQQRDPVATQMALVPARERDAFMQHWERILRDENVVVKAIVVDGGAVAGHVVSFERDGKREVGYWLGRPFWGRGIATRALAEFLRLVPERPLHAIVAATHDASIRVLAKCGFTLTRSERRFDERLGEEIDVLLFELR
jgi:RimJ/RimL family protein N-acetyltransferase